MCVCVCVCVRACVRVYVCMHTYQLSLGRKKMLFKNTQHNLFTVLWCQTYGKRPLSKRRNPLLPHGLLYSLAPSHRQDNTYHSLCYTSCGALARTRDRSDNPSCQERTLYLAPVFPRAINTMAPALVAC